MHCVRNTARVRSCRKHSYKLSFDVMPLPRHCASTHPRAVTCSPSPPFPPTPLGVRSSGDAGVERGKGRGETPRHQQACFCFPS